MQPLLWCDIETSGLDPKRHTILEIAVVATDEKLEVQDEICFIVQHNDKIFWSTEASKIHAASGLYDLLKGARHGMLDVEDRLIAWIDHEQRFTGRMLASSSPHGVDIPFLEEHMPHLRKCFHGWRTFDVRTLLTFFGEKKPACIPHRSLADLHQDIKLVRKFMKRVHVQEDDHPGLRWGHSQLP